MIRWWPLVGLAGLGLLGVAVGGGSTAIDEAFFAAQEDHRWLAWLLVFTDGRLMAGLWAVVLAVALWRRRWRLAAVVAGAPLLAVVAARLAKQMFGRYKDDALAYPSGHTTLAVVVLGMSVLVAGAATWAIVTAVTVALLGALGQGFTYHYLTDAVGAVFLGTALVCLAALAAGLDGCQPSCDVDHNGD